MIDIRFVDTAVVFYLIGYLGAMKRLGRLHWADFKFWGDDVSPEKRRNDLMGLAVIVALVVIRVLFGIYN